MTSLALLTTLYSAQTAGQAKPEPALGAASSVSRAAEDGSRPSRLEENIQHGFFGDLSRPAIPALNRIDGIRLPAAAPSSGASDSRPGSPTAPVPIALPPAGSAKPAATKPTASAEAKADSATEPRSVASKGSPAAEPVTSRPPPPQPHGEPR